MIQQGRGKARSAPCTTHGRKATWGISASNIADAITYLHVMAFTTETASVTTCTSSLSVYPLGNESGQHRAYDHVMVYKFHEDKEGEVIEIKCHDVETYLGLHNLATPIRMSHSSTLPCSLHCQHGFTYIFHHGQYVNSSEEEEGLHRAMGLVDTSPLL